MYEDITPEVLKERVLSRLSDKINTHEGSFANDIVSPACVQMYGVYQSLNAVKSMAFPDTTSGEYIDIACKDYGIRRKPGTKATVTLTFEGKPGTIIPKDTIILTESGLQFATDADAEITETTITVTANAAEIGTKYNVAKNTLTRQFKSVQGVTAVNNLEPAVGGTDAEGNKALLERLNARRQRPTTSGNPHHYYQWALEAKGVGAAKVFPVWNGNGTVKIVVASEELQPVDESITTSCKEYIETQRPIGAEVTVISAAGVPITVTANVITVKNNTLADIITEFKDKITEYVKSVAFKENTVSYNYIGYLLMGIKGVAEYSSLKLNGSTANIELTEDQVPTAGEVNLIEIT